MRLNGADDPATPPVRELRRFVSRVDFTKHRLGIVSYWGDTLVELPLTHDRAAALRTIQSITRKWPVCYQREYDGAVVCNLLPRIGARMHTAQAQFDPAGSARRVMVLYQPHYCNRAFEYYDGACRGYVPAEEEAAAIRAAGTRVVVFDGNRSSYREYRFDGTRYNGDAQPLGSSDKDVVFDNAAAQHRLVNYVVPDAVGSRRAWLPRDPLRPDPQAVAVYADGWGHPGRIVFPAPTEVPGPRAIYLPHVAAVWAVMD